MTNYEYYKENTSELSYSLDPYEDDCNVRFDMQKIKECFNLPLDECGTSLCKLTELTLSEHENSCDLCPFTNFCGYHSKGTTNWLKESTYTNEDVFECRNIAQ